MTGAISRVVAHSEEKRLEGRYPAVLLTIVVTLRDNRDFYDV